MNEERVTQLLAQLDEPASPDPAYSDALYDRLRIQAQARRRGRRRAVILIVAGAAVIAAAAAGAALALRSGMIQLGADPSATAMPSAAGSSEPPPTTSPSADARPDPGVSNGSGAPSDRLVETAVESLRLRESPGTDGRQLGLLQLGTLGLVISGPDEIEGIPWYQLSGMGVPYDSGCITPPPSQVLECPAFLGWVAGASPAGDPWLQPATFEACPSLPTTVEELRQVQFTLRIVCWSGEDMTLMAWWPAAAESPTGGTRCDADVAQMPGGWLFCQGLNENVLAAGPQSGAPGVRFSVDPASGVTPPPRGTWVEFTGHYDDPAAELCGSLAEGAGQDPAVAVFECRLELVATSITPVSRP